MQITESEGDGWDHTATEISLIRCVFMQRAPWVGMGVVDIGIAWLKNCELWEHRLNLVLARVSFFLVEPQNGLLGFLWSQGSIQHLASAKDEEWEMRGGLQKI